MFFNQRVAERHMRSEKCNNSTTQDCSGIDWLETICG